MSDRRVALVSGASAGMGKEIALQLHQAGYVVYAFARRLEAMEDLREKGIKTYRGDITKEEDLKLITGVITEEQGHINALINNAGYGLYGAVEDIPIQDAKNQFEVNLFGLARLTQLCLPLLRNKRGSKVINISSMGGRIYSPLGAWYHASKHALEGWSDSLRLELKQFNIHVVIVEPGMIGTEFGDVLIEKMMKTSGDGKYKSMAEQLSQSIKKFEEPGNHSPASVVAEVVLKAAQSDKPKTRYPVGKMARQMLFMRKHLPDRWFDFLMSKF